MQFLQYTALCRENLTNKNRQLELPLENISFSKNKTAYFKNTVETIFFSLADSELLRNKQESNNYTAVKVTVQAVNKTNAFHKIQSSENPISQEKVEANFPTKNQTERNRNTTSGSVIKIDQLITQYACRLNSESKGKIEFSQKNDSGFYLKKAIKSGVKRINENITNIIQKSLPASQASFISGVVFGGLSDLPQNRQDEFQIVGLTHILVASGYNVLLVANSIILLFQKFTSYRLRRILALIFVWIYAFLTGFTPPVIRAVLMTTLVLMAQLFGRPSKTLWVFGFTIIIVLIANPLLVFNLSFQLSVLATAAVIWGSPSVFNLLVKKDLQPNLTFWQLVKATVVENFVATIAALLFTAPLIAYHFERLSLIAVVANVVLLPFVPVLMALGCLLIVVGIVHPFLALILGIGLSGVITIFFEVVHIFSSPQWASITVTVELRQMGIYYLILAIAVYLLHKNEKNR